MSHEIFGERFWGHRKPAWHSLGEVFQESLTATQVLERVQATRPISFEKWEGFFISPDKQNLLAQNKSVILRRSPDGDEVLGLVSKEFQILSPEEIGQIWDSVLGWEIETLFFTRNRMVITSRLPQVGLHPNDPSAWNLHAILDFPYQPGIPIQARIAPVRVVCMNTLAASKLEATLNVSARHNSKEIRKIEVWLDSWARSYHHTVRELEATLNLFAKTPIKWEEISEEFFAEVFKQNFEKRLENFNRMQIYGTSVETGSMLGWLNAITEYADWANRHKETELTTLFGHRYNLKQKAFEFATTVAIG